MSQMKTIVFDSEVFKNPTNMAVRCECGKLQGNAEVIGIPKGKSGAREYKLSYQVTGRFYEKRDLLHCVECHKPALSGGKDDTSAHVTATDSLTSLTRFHPLRRHLAQ